MEEYAYKVVDVNDGSCVVKLSSKFYLTYKKGKRVKAPKGSLGIMVFSTMDRAAYFKNRIWGRKTHKIKKVIPIGTPTYPTTVAHTGTDISAFNEMTAEERMDYRNCGAPPVGTVCYPEVIVVD